METRDLPEVMRIEKASFTLQWSQRFFLDELKLDVSRTWVVTVGSGNTEEVAGYVCCRFVAGDANILNIAVARSWRRMGLGRTLLQKVISEARKHLCHNVSLEVRRSNEVAQNLYCSEGFVVSGTRKRYYSDNGEDALVMVLNLQTSRSA